MCSWRQCPSFVLSCPPPFPWPLIAFQWSRKRPPPTPPSVRFVLCGPKGRSVSSRLLWISIAFTTRSPLSSAARSLPPRGPRQLPPPSPCHQYPAHVNCLAQLPTLGIHCVLAALCPLLGGVLFPRDDWATLLFQQKRCSSFKCQLAFAAR